MKKLFLLLAATGMIIASAGAQTQRVNRTNTRTKDAGAVQAQPQEAVVLPTVQADPVDQRSAGTTGIDGSVNDKANSGMNRSSSLQYDYKTGTVPPQNVPASTSPAAPATPARTNTPVR